MAGFSLRPHKHKISAFTARITICKNKTQNVDALLLGNGCGYLLRRKIWQIVHALQNLKAKKSTITVLLAKNNSINRMQLKSF